MKAYTVTMRSNNEYEILTVISPIDPGTEIGWGEDDRTGEIRTWIVTECRETEI